MRQSCTHPPSDTRHPMRAQLDPRRRRVALRIQLARRVRTARRTARACSTVSGGGRATSPRPPRHTVLGVGVPPPQHRAGRQHLLRTRARAVGDGHAHRIYGCPPRLRHACVRCDVRAVPAPGRRSRRRTPLTRPTPPQPQAAHAPVAVRAAAQPRLRRESPVPAKRRRHTTSSVTAVHPQRVNTSSLH